MLILIILGLILLTVGKAFFSLSKKYGKNKIGITILGLLSFIIGVTIYIITYALLVDVLSGINRYVHEYLSFSLGIALAVFFHYYLEKKWKKNKNVDAEEAIDKIGKD